MDQKVSHCKIKGYIEKKVEVFLSYGADGGHERPRKVANSDVHDN